MKTELTDEQKKQALELCASALEGRLETMYPNDPGSDEWETEKLPSLEDLVGYVTGRFTNRRYRIAPRRLSFRESVRACYDSGVSFEDKTHGVHMIRDIEGRVLFEAHYPGGGVERVGLHPDWLDAEWEEVTG